MTEFETPSAGDLAAQQDPAADSPVIEGDVQNGSLLAVAFRFFTGEAGVRDRGDGKVEFAYFGSPPSGVRLPASGTIDGEAYSATEARRSATARRMTVVTAVKI